MTSPVRAIALGLILSCPVTWTSSGMLSHLGFSWLSPDTDTHKDSQDGSTAADVRCPLSPGAAIPEDYDPLRGPMLARRVVHTILYNPGSCPNDVNNPECEGFDSKQECDLDYNCDGREKCCLYGCKKRCLLPLEDKLGSCPYFDDSECKHYNVRTNVCQDDEQCPGSDRCCCYNCRRQCTPTVRVTPGQCPVNNMKCQDQEPEPRCQNDSDCPDALKCCESCGKQCLEPIKEHPGYCPVSNEQMSCITSLGKPSCRNDADCEENEKCCLSGDRVQCVPGLKEKKGVCPSAVIICKKIQYSSNCKSDKDCPGDKKCCITGCFRKCVDWKHDYSGYDKTGVCPYFDATKCDYNRYQCGSCSRDEDCPGTCKCCCFNCKMQCMTTVRVKPGQCPAKTMTCQDKESKPSCENDYDCREDLKCCDSCGKKCLEPIKEHPGYCPTNNEQDICITSLGKPSCSNDANCNENEKCCLSGDQMQCVTAVKEKKGICPDKHSYCLQQFTKDECKGDEDCARDEKCCHIGCRKICKQSVIRITCMADSRYYAGYTEPFVPGECLLPGETERHYSDVKKCCDYDCVFQCVDV